MHPHTPPAHSFTSPVMHAPEPAEVDHHAHTTYHSSPLHTLSRNSQLLSQHSLTRSHSHTHPSHENFPEPGCVITDDAVVHIHADPGLVDEDEERSVDLHLSRNSSLLVGLTHSRTESGMHGFHQPHLAVAISPPEKQQTIELAQAPNAEASEAMLPARLTPLQWILLYCAKWRGTGEASMPRPSAPQMLISFIGAFSSIALLSLLQQYAHPGVELIFLIGSFGASAVILFGTPESKLGQPRNLIGGHVVGAVTGATVRLILPESVLWLSSALGMSLSLVFMQATRTVHPPGGATALIAASVVKVGLWNGFSFVITVLIGACIMGGMSLIVNNVSTRRAYPTYWI